MTIETLSDGDLDALYSSVMAGIQAPQQILNALPGFITGATLADVPEVMKPPQGKEKTG